MSRPPLFILSSEDRLVKLFKLLPALFAALMVLAIGCGGPSKSELKAERDAQKAAFDKTVREVTEAQLQISAVLKENEGLRKAVSDVDDKLVIINQDMMRLNARLDALRTELVAVNESMTKKDAQSSSGGLLTWLIILVVAVVLVVLILRLIRSRSEFEEEEDDFEDFEDDDDLGFDDEEDIENELGADKKGTDEKEPKKDADEKEPKKGDDKA
jgi:hypothetical protein